jgi:hypothetical protein
MKSIVYTVAALTIAAMFAPAAHAQNQKAQRANMSYVLSFGRFATPDEIRYWNGRSDANNWSVEQFVNTHAAWLTTPGADKAPSEVEKTIIAAVYAAQGPAGDYSKIFQKHRSGLGRTWRTYIDLTKILTQEMDKDKPLKDKAVRAAYREAGLGFTEQDVWGWVNGFGNGKSYIQIVAEHHAYKLGKSGLKPQYASRADAVMSEALRIPGASMVAAGGGNILVSLGGNLVAAGGGNVIAIGGNNMVAAGGGNMVAAGGGNLTSMFQNTVGILQNGASFVPLGR